MQRAELGIDGNAAYALLGEDLQMGEAEFETIDPTQIVEVGAVRAERAAAWRAYQKLKTRVPLWRGEEYSYRLGPGLGD